MYKNLILKNIKNILKIITICMPDRLIWGGLLLHLKFLLNPRNIKLK